MTLNKNKKLNGVTKIARLSYFAPDRKRLGSISLTKGRMPKSIAHYKHDEQLGEIPCFHKPGISDFTTNWTQDKLGAWKMNDHENLRLREPDAAPTSEMLEQILGDSYAAYETFQDALPSLEIEQEWQWYTPYKAWFAKGQHFWTTPRGTRKEKNLYWLYVYEGYFSVAVWFKEKNRAEVLSADVSDETKTVIRDAETMGKMPTFPVVFEITTVEQLADIYALLDCKKRIEK